MWPSSCTLPSGAMHETATSISWRNLGYSSGSWKIKILRGPMSPHHHHNHHHPPPPPPPTLPKPLGVAINRPLRVRWEAVIKQLFSQILASVKSSFFVRIGNILSKDSFFKITPFDISEIETWVCIKCTSDHPNASEQWGLELIHFFSIRNCQNQKKTLNLAWIVSSWSFQTCVRSTGTFKTPTAGTLYSG